ncbi:hypothetical protein QMK17_23555 [Rhodococcus sp. G-MC3]|uniref:hypothetical protein n=1 Tax=Rhodococcus sp. G-MC3 TaxID=3046209 RepID=UPI0024B903C8|nr:hypothetical protein [Rhodococcus sp. G-MC3]MDJ0396286.1 hypothetical protein [Rhodococcus sp. G-MC3]
MEQDHQRFADHIEANTTASEPALWTPGWPEEVEAALLDAVFSARASYGGPETGVRRVVSRWRAHRGLDRLDDLGALVAFADRPDELAEILGNRQRVAGNSTTKAEAVLLTATALHNLGVRTTEDLDDDAHRTAFTAVTGVGTKTWECVLFMAGRRTLDSLLHFIAFTSAGVGRTLSGAETEILMQVTAEDMGVELAALEHAVWRYQRRIPLPKPASPLRDAG